MRLRIRAIVGSMLALTCVAAGAAEGNLFRLLHGEHEAAQARADLINAATTSIETSYYWIGDDSTGAWYASLLKNAALRGVRVRLVVDAEHNDIPPAVQRHLIACGVHIKEYHPHLTGHPGWQDRRMHDKTLIVDGRHLVAGSRNMRDCHFGRARLNYVDRDAYLYGEVARQARRYFDCLWLSDQVRPTDFRPTLVQRVRLATSANDPEVSAASSKNICSETWLATGCGLTVCGRPVDCCADRDWSADAHPAECVWFVYDPCGVKGHPYSIEEQLLRLLDGACASIVLETPYFVMSPQERRALADATARGVHVTLLTNSLASTDHLIVAAEFTNQRRWLLAHDVEIWELAGPNHLHAKSAVVDGQIAFVGSYNFDPRSQSLNTETGVIVRDASVAEWVLNSIGEHLSRSYQFTPEGRAVVDGSRHPGAPLGRIIGMQPLRLLVPLVRRTL
ncbi:MAG TPA: phosphatidylserine/phosphatidylglycerophosphate/cardiolipin synthase family protein [Pirellulales bacterium]|nr:phosphatidylserine/phosphatidylglycerophosphate/cardiolipin synthase family protein [Pirellulales bacterium]